MKSIIINIINWCKDDERTAVDYTIIFNVIILIAIGIVMVYSSSIAFAAAKHNQYYFLIKHLISIALGIVSGLCAFAIDTTIWKKYSTHIIIVTILLLIAVLIPHIGHSVNGSRRWIDLIIIKIQPSELAKLSVIIYLSDFISKHSIKNVKRLIAILAISIAMIGLILLEPDMGSATVIFIIAISILYLGNIDRKIINTSLLVGVIGFIILAVIAPYRMRRILGFIDPWHDALGKGYQLTHSLLAIGHGGWTGVGIGNSIEKLFYLPEAYTDFILSITAEETGVCGMMVILALFWMLFYRGFFIIGAETKNMPQRRFQSTLAQGIVIWFFVQAIINFGVVIGALPTKGLTLPFISFGGMSMITSCIAIGILLKINYENKRLQHITDISFTK